MYITYIPMKYCYIMSQVAVVSTPSCALDIDGPSCLI